MRKTLFAKLDNTRHKQQFDFFLGFYKKEVYLKGGEGSERYIAMYNAKKHLIITEVARRSRKFIFNHSSGAFVFISFSLEQQGCSRPPLCNRTPEISPVKSLDAQGIVYPHKFNDCTIWLMSPRSLKNCGRSQWSVYDKPIPPGHHNVTEITIFPSPVFLLIH